MLARAAMYDHEVTGELRGNQEFEAGAATRNIDDLAIDGRRLRIENELAGLRDETARPDTRVSAVLYFASFNHDIANKPSYRRSVKAGLMVSGPEGGERIKRKNRHPGVLARQSRVYPRSADLREPRRATARTFHPFIHPSFEARSLTLVRSSG